MRQFGARAFDLDIDTATGLLLPPEGQPFDAAGLRETVEQAGFELLGIELEVRGRPTRIRGPGGQELFAVEVDGTGQTFALAEGDSDLEHEAWARILPDLSQPESRLRVRGRLHTHPQGPPTLFVQDFRWGAD